MFTLKRVIFLPAVVLSVTACSSSNNLYYWGNYNDAVYAYYNEPGNLAEQEQSLTSTVNTAKEKGKQVGPGVYAQLGYLQLKQGKRNEAQAAFQQEVSLYPESVEFIRILQGQRNIRSTNKKGGK